jgi:hypothetical protein
MLRSLLTLAAGVAATPAFAQIAPECADIPMPDDYDEQAQADFMANSVALATSWSPVHGPIPHQPGHGAIGVNVGVIPPLSCERRFVLSHTKTEDTNKSPAVPRLFASAALPAVGKVVPYLSFGYIPPVPLLGTTNVIVSGELGAGLPLGPHAQVGARFHATLQKTIGEIATPFTADEPAYDDLYLASTYGADGLFGWSFGAVTPYVALGWMDASTFFYIGDDAVVANNLHPYNGPTTSLGVDALGWKHLRVGGELYAAWGGYSTPDDTVDSITPASRYGRMYTGRIRVGYEF